MRRLLVYACLLPLTVCSGTDELADTAGVQVVDVQQGVLSSLKEWTIDSFALVIGGSDGAPQYSLHLARSPISLSGGRIAVANEHSEVRFYDSSGKFIASKGRRGGGPGEFRQLWSLHVLDGDSIVAIDASARRASVLDSQGRFARAYVLPALAPTFVASPNGTMFYTTEEPPCKRARSQRAPTVVVQDTVQLVRVAVGTNRSDTIARVAGKWFQCWGGDWDGVALSGDLLLAVGASSVVVAQGDHFVLRWFDAEGHPTHITRVALKPTPVHDEDIVRFDSARLAGRRCKTPSCGTPPDRQFPRHLPMLADVLIDRLGQSWVQRWSAANTEQSRWVVFDSAGRPIGQARLPAALQVSDIGRDFVLGLFKDSDGVQSVRRYRLRR